MAIEGEGPVGANPAQVNPYAAPVSDALADDARDARTLSDDARADLYVVSLTKFYALSLSTLGFYTLYWFFVHFRTQRRSGMRTKPVLAALFSLFTVHRLFKRIDRSAFNAGMPESQRAVRYAWPYTALVVAAYTLSLIGQNSVLLSWVSMALSLAINVPLASVQRIINRLAGDEKGTGNAQFSAGNIVTIVVGGIVWVLFFMGTAMRPAAH